MEPVRAEAGGMVHSANWTYGEWIGRTACGYEFATPKNQWQRFAPDGRLIAKRTLTGVGPREMIMLEGREDVNCMSCLVREARGGG